MIDVPSLISEQTNENDEDDEGSSGSNKSPGGSKSFKFRKSKNSPLSNQGKSYQQQMEAIKNINKDIDASFKSSSFVGEE